MEMESTARPSSVDRRQLSFKNKPRPPSKARVRLRQKRPSGDVPVLPDGAKSWNEFCLSAFRDRVCEVGLPPDVCALIEESIRAAAMPELPQRWTATPVPEEGRGLHLVLEVAPSPARRPLFLLASVDLQATRSLEAANPSNRESLESINRTTVTEAVRGARRGLAPTRFATVLHFEPEELAAAGDEALLRFELREAMGEDETFGGQHLGFFFLPVADVMAGGVHPLLPESAAPRAEHERVVLSARRVFPGSLARSALTPRLEMVQAYAFSVPLSPRRWLLAHERCAEPRNAALVCCHFLRQRLEELEAQRARWRRNATRTRVAFGHFESEAEAAAHGFVCVQVAVEQGKELPPPPSRRGSSNVAMTRSSSDSGSGSSLSGSPAPPSDSKKGKAAVAMLGRALESGMTYATNFKEMRKARSEGSGSKCCAFVRVALVDAAGNVALHVGRTNTEYLTDAPVWGSNARANLCPIPARANKTFSAVPPSDVVGGGFLRFWVPTHALDERESDLKLRFDVIHERFSIKSGEVSEVPLGSVEVGLCAAAAAETEEEKERGVWRQISPSVSVVDHGGGKWWKGGAIRTKIRVGTAHASDAPLRPRSLSATPPAAFDALLWVAQHGQLLDRDCAMLRRMAEASDARFSDEAAGGGFKRSVEKEDLALGALPTNLHHANLIVRDVVGEGAHTLHGASCATLGRYALTTVGIPAAHVLGLKDRSLRRLCQQVDALCASSAATPPLSPSRGVGGQESAQHEMELPPDWDPSQVEVWAAPEKRERIAAEHELFVRGTVVQSQALSAMITAFVGALELAAASDALETSLEQWLDLGFFVGWESLVSTQGSEFVMLEDAIEAVRSLKGCTLEIHCEDGAWEGGGYNVRLRRVPSSRPLARVAIELRFGGALHAKLARVATERGADSMLVLRVLSCLVSVGVNENQSLEVLSSKLSKSARARIEAQTALNADSLRSLRDYCEGYLEWLLRRSGASAEGHSTATVGGDVVECMKRLSEEESLLVGGRARDKQTNVLAAAADAVRAVSGARITSCKSGKDRTAMSATLEFGRIIARAHGGAVSGDAAAIDAQSLHGDEHGERGNGSGSSDYAAEDEAGDEARVRNLANVMRMHGPRIWIAHKNVGKPCFAFNALQRGMLPRDYRPPLSRINQLTGGRT